MKVDSTFIDFVQKVFSKTGTYTTKISLILSQPAGMVEGR
jgi:hypothetical protein